METEKLLRIADLSNEQIQNILEAALLFDQNRCEPEALQSVFASRKDVNRKPVALIFQEASTRTRISFERAAQLVGRPTVLLESKGSSFEKGESLEDTVLNLRALGFGCFVVRFQHSADLESLKAIKNISVINAGDGMGEHPTQALLDLATLAKHVNQSSELKAFKGFRLAILGDLRHSRVAQSWSELAKALEMELHLVSPPEWRPQSWGHAHQWSSEKAEALKGARAVMALRVQKERLETGRETPESVNFAARYQVGPDDLKKDQWLLHPGPVNWGVELSPALRTDSRSLILEQPRLGLALRSVLLAGTKN